MDEEFFIARVSFDKVIPEKSLYKHRYSFDYWCRYTEVEKHYEFLISNKAEKDSIVSDSIEMKIINDSIPPVQAEQKQAFATISEPEYVLEKYKYVSDSLVIVDIYDNTGVLTAYEERQYKRGKLTATGRFSAIDDALVAKESFRHDANNRLVNKTVFYPKNYVETKYHYSWNEKHESYNYSFVNFVYKFDLHGFTTRKERYSGNTLLAATVFIYNSFGDIICERETDMLANLVKEIAYEYEYDTNTNWTSCIERRPDGNIFIRKRNIIYY
jgi:nuclear transport factor 2 (NTF2) superfamily protein